MMPPLPEGPRPNTEGLVVLLGVVVEGVVVEGVVVDGVVVDGVVLLPVELNEGEKPQQC